MSGPSTIPLSAGDRAPMCIGVTAQGNLYAFEEQAGRAVVAILAPDLDAPELPALLAGLSARADELAGREVDLVALIGADVERVFDYNFLNPSRVTLVGSLNRFLEAIGFAGPTPDLLLLDRNLRAAARRPAGDPDGAVEAILAAVRALPDEPEHDVWMPAPLLLLPNLLDQALCAELIDLHRAGPTFESPVLTTDAQGRPQHKLDHGFKKRRDLLLDRDHPMYLRVADLILGRCIPEIRRAFQARVSHADRFLIACYPGDGGHFRRHRDNRPALVSFRRFALSINLTLSAAGYQGGFLRLPEFGPHRFRCPTGGGLIFSVDLLHEITPVLSGDRYVLVTHFHDEEGEAQWLAYRAAMAATRKAD